MRVVVNRCYGGFELSDEALAWLRERLWEYCNHPRGAPRHDPLLVECVEVLGQRANGKYAELSVEDAGSSAYRIVEYDGFEHVESVDSDAEVAQAVERAVTADRAAIRAEVERRRADRSARFEATNRAETLGEELALSKLLAWLDQRSKT